MIMCGFSGICSSIPVYSNQLVASLKQIKHRGPDDTLIASVIGGKPAMFSCSLSSEYTARRYAGAAGAQSNCWFGFNRLSIIDRSAKGMQPFYDEERNCSFMMNGEIYNYKELRAGLLQRESFKSDSDTEVAFKLYLKYGDDFINHLQGMFAIVVIHHTENILKAWRDRFGIKPFFFSATDRSFIFSSEIYGLFATGLTDKKINFQNLASQFYLQTSASPHTIYENVNSLEPACRLIADLSTFATEVKRYWSLRYNPEQRRIGNEEFLADIQHAARISLAADANIGKGVMLSGGIDSGTLAYLFREEKDSLSAFTIYNQKYKHLNEIDFARLNARNAGLHLEEFSIPDIVSEDTVTAFCLAEEEPNTAPEPAYYLSEMVKGKCTILYNALGLDELFYGYSYHWQSEKLGKINRSLYPSIALLLRGGKKQKLNEIIKYTCGAMPFINRANADWKSITALFKEYGADKQPHPAELIYEQAKNIFPSISDAPVLKQITFLDFHYYISSHHSFRSDRPAMLNSIEMRFPFLDHLFVQKYFNIDNIGKGLSRNYNKPFVRNYVRSLLDPQVMNMSKKGFGMPATSWTGCVDWEKTVNELSPLFDRKKIEAFTAIAHRKWALISLNKINSFLSGAYGW